MHVTNLSSRLGNIQIHDLTNYPNSLNCHCLEKIRPSEIFGKGTSAEGEDGRGLMDLTVDVYNKYLSGMGESEPSIVMELFIEKISVNFYMQVFMRTINKIVDVWVPVLMDPFMDTAEPDKGDWPEDSSTSEDISKLELEKESLKTGEDTLSELQALEN
jgi:hypothetical protein